MNAKSTSMSLAFQRMSDTLEPEPEQKLLSRFGFFRTVFNFSPPYHFLVDNTFVCSVVANEKFNIEEYVTNVFNAKCKLLLTTCVLKKLKKSFPENATINKLIDQEMLIYKCPHSRKPRAPSECLTALANCNRFRRSLGAPRGKRHVLINGENPRYIIATQREDLLKVFREIPGVPVVFFQDGKLAMDTISPINKEWAMVLKLKNMESMAVEMEILAHAIANEAEASKKAANETAAENSGESNTEKVESVVIEDNSSIKRKRQLSPDICDVPMSSSSFSKYRKLLRSRDKSKDGCSKGYRHRREHGKVPHCVTKSLQLLIAAGLSSSEFDILI